MHFYTRVTSVDPDHPAQQRNNLMNQKANSLDPDQIA
jgi:hypothetical protein